MIHFKNFFLIEYWLSQPAGMAGFVLWIFCGLFLIMTIGGIALKIISKYQENKINKIIMRRLSGLGAVMGLWGLIWIFFRQENVALLGWRMWMLLWCLAFLWWLANILRYIIKRVPEIIKEKEKIEKFAKYLPSAKK